MMFKFSRSCLAASLCLLLHASAAFAHAFPERSEPPAGAARDGSLGRVRIWFDTEIEPALSTLRVVDPQGRQVRQGVAQLVSAQSRLLEASVPPLTPGAYHVFWHVVARDGHVSDGDFPFTVRR